MIYAFRPVNLLSLVCLFAHFCIVPYHNMDNLLSLSREGDITSSLKGIVDNLSMTYDGNRLASVSDSAPAPSVTGSADFRDGVSEVVEYTYDRNGNMTSDLNRKVSLISYNRQNRPARMRHAGGTETFTYLPDGTKRGRTVLGKDRSLSRTEYRGNLVCADDTLKYILFDGGLIAMDGASPEYLFFLRDHLGSVRVVARPDGKAVQVNHYYPYGMAFAGGGMSGNAGAHPVEGGVSVAGGSLEIGGETGGMELARPGASQPYRFLGNELYTSNSLGLYDFSARMYDPALGRFLSVDPMAEGYRHLSPYAYCAGNPVVYADKDGKNINPVYSQDGTYRGNTLEGFTGDVIIYDGDKDFSNMSASELLYGEDFDVLTQRGTANTYDTYRNELSGDAKSKIWTHLASQMEGKQVYDKVFSLSSLKDGIISFSSSSRGSWNSRIDIKTINGTDKYSYETTVENIQSSIIIHEWYSHIIKGNCDQLKSHRLAYKNVINYKPLWDKTTDNYKRFNLRQLLKYTTKETKRTNVDSPYRNIYNKYMNY